MALAMASDMASDIVFNAPFKVSTVALFSL